MGDRSEAWKLLVLGIGMLMAMAIGGWFLFSMGFFDPAVVPAAWQSYRQTDPVRAVLVLIGGYLLLLAAMIALLSGTRTDEAITVCAEQLEQVALGHSPVVPPTSRPDDLPLERLERAVANLVAGILRDRAMVTEVANLTAMTGDRASALGVSFSATGQLPGPLGAVATSLREALARRLAAATAIAEQLQHLQTDYERIGNELARARQQAEVSNRELDLLRAQTDRDRRFSNRTRLLEIGQRLEQVLAGMHRLEQQVGEVTPALVAAEAQMANADQALAAIGPELDRLEARHTSFQGALEQPLQCSRKAGDQRRALAEPCRMQVDAIHQLEERLKIFGRLREVFNELVTQANLLGLNAALEASRSGMRGKGFSLIAHELRNLAERTAAAVKPFDPLLAELQALVQRAGQAANELLAPVRDLAVAVDSLSASLQNVSESGAQLMAGWRGLAVGFDGQRHRASVQQGEPWQLVTRFGTWQGDLEHLVRQAEAVHADIVGWAAGRGPDLTGTGEVVGSSAGACEDVPGLGVAASETVAVVSAPGPVPVTDPALAPGPLGSGGGG